MAPDGAGWHPAKALRVPPNVTVAPLPPYSPQLNPMERVCSICAPSRDTTLSSTPAARPGMPSPTMPTASGFSVSTRTYRKSSGDHAGITARPTAGTAAASRSRPGGRPRQRTAPRCAAPPSLPPPRPPACRGPRSPARGSCGARGFRKPSTLKKRYGSVS